MGSRDKPGYDVSVFQRRAPTLVTDPRLTAYVARCTARLAFGRAHAAQMGDFREAA